VCPNRILLGSFFLQGIQLRLEFLRDLCIDGFFASCSGSPAIDGTAAHFLFFTVNIKMAAGSLKSLVKTGFGLGLGVFAAQIIFVLLGMMFFLPGLYLLKKDKNDKSSNGSGSYYLGVGLMLVGVVLMGGIGFGEFMNDLDW